MARIGKGILLASIGTVLIWTSLIGGVLYRLTLGPLDLSAYENYISSIVNSLYDRGKITFSSPQLSWRGFGYPLEISLLRRPLLLMIIIFLCQKYVLGFL
jgi:hypothetical protein